MYAGFWRRFAAAMLDLLILGVAILVTGVIVALITGPRSRASAMTDLGSLAAPWLYFALMECSPLRATLGKLAFGIRVVDLRGARLSFLRASARFFAKIFSTLPLALGHLLAAFTRNKQALHDLVTGCVVVDAKAPAIDLRRAGLAQPLSGRAIAALLAGAAFLPLAAAGSAVAIPKYQDHLVRKKIIAAIESAHGATSSVSAYMLKHKTPPRTLEEAGAVAVSPNLRNAAIGRDGAIILTVAVEPVVGKRIALVPTRSQNRIVWTCTSDEIPARYLPRDCRQRR